MTLLTVTAKGQVTLRKDILEHLGVRPGDRIAVEKTPGGRLEVRALPVAGKISEVFDLLKRDDGPSLSVEEIGRIASEGWRGER